MATFRENLPHRKKERRGSDGGGYSRRDFLRKAPAALAGTSVVPAWCAGRVPEERWEQVERRTHEGYREEEVRRCADALGQVLNIDTHRSREVVEGFDAVALDQFTAGDRDYSKPLLIHVGQNHGTEDEKTQNTSDSQIMVSRSLVSLVENNNTGKILPIVLEKRLELSEEEKKLDYTQKNDILLRKYLHEAVSIRPAPDSLLNLIAYFTRPEKARKIIRGSDAVFDAAVHPFTELDNYLDNDDREGAVEYLVTQLREIENSWGFHISLGDDHDSVSNRAVDDLEILRDEFGFRDEPEDTAYMRPWVPRADRSWEDLERIYDSIVIERDKLFTRNAMQLAKDFGTGVAVIVLGSAHDLRDDAERAGVNLMRVETAPSNVHHGLVGYTRLKTELDMRSIMNNEESLRKATEHWIQRHGGHEKVAQIFEGGHFHDVLFRHLGAFHREFNFSPEQLLSITGKGIEVCPHEYAHGLFINESNLENVRHYLSDEGFNDLTQALDAMRCDGHE